MPAYDSSTDPALVNAILAAFETFMGYPTSMESMVGTIRIDLPLFNDDPKWAKFPEACVYATPNWDGEPDIINIAIEANGQWSRYFNIPVKWSGDIEQDTALWAEKMAAYWPQIAPIIEEVAAIHAAGIGPNVNDWQEATINHPASITRTELLMVG